LSPRRTLGWVAAGAAVVVVALFWINLIGSGQVSGAGVIGGVILVALIVGVVAAIGTSRARTLRRIYPKGFVSTIAMYGQFLVQLKAVTNALGVDLAVPQSRRSGTVVLDDSFLRVYVGIVKPIELVAIPASDITRIGIAKAEQGKWILDSLEIGFESAGGGLAIDFCVMNTGFGFPHVVARKELERQLLIARSATG
jgi:hypothetical protein